MSQPTNEENKSFCEKHFEIKKCGYWHPVLNKDLQCAFCELERLRQDYWNETKKHDSCCVQLKALREEVERLKICPATHDKCCDYEKEIASLRTALKEAGEALKKIRSFVSREFNSGAAPWYVQECAERRYMLDMVLSSPLLKAVMEGRVEG